MPVVLQNTSSTALLTYLPLHPQGTRNKSKKKSNRNENIRARTTTKSSGLKMIKGR